MVIDKVKGDIFASACRHIAFAVNTEGSNDAGFAGHVASRYWPELEEMGEAALGEVRSRRCGHYTFHALVCHVLDVGGFAQTPRYVEECLNKLDVPDDQVIGVVLMGSGPVGRALKADVPAIVEAMHRSTKSLIIYSLT